MAKVREDRQTPSTSLMIAPLLRIRYRCSADCCSRKDLVEESEISHLSLNDKSYRLLLYRNDQKYVELA